MTDLALHHRLPTDERRPRETDAEWERRTAPREPSESDAQYYRRKLGEEPRHPFYKPGRTICLSVQGGCPACLAVLEWRALDGVIAEMAASEALARREPAAVRQWAAAQARKEEEDKRKRLAAEEYERKVREARERRREKRRERKRAAEQAEWQRECDRRNRSKPLPLHCKGCGWSCERCARLVDRKCCPDCSCGPWFDRPARQLGLPFEQRCLDLEPILNPESLSSFFYVTGRRL